VQFAGRIELRLPVSDKKTPSVKGNPYAETSCYVWVDGSTRADRDGRRLGFDHAVRRRQVRGAAAAVSVGERDVDYIRVEGELPSGGREGEQAESDQVCSSGRICWRDESQNRGQSPQNRTKKNRALTPAPVSRFRSARSLAIGACDGVARSRPAARDKRSAAKASGADRAAACLPGRSRIRVRGRAEGVLVSVS